MTTCPCGNVAENLYYCCNLKRVIYCEKLEIIFHSHTPKNFSYCNSDLKNIKKNVSIRKINLLKNIAGIEILKQFSVFNAEKLISRLHWSSII